MKRGERWGRGGGEAGEAGGTEGRREGERGSFGTWGAQGAQRCGGGDHYAAQEGRLDVADVLFRYGAKLDALTEDGETPADIATANGHLAFADAVRAEEIRRRDHGFKRDRSTIEGTEEHEAAKRPRVDEEAKQAEEVDVDESDDDDEDDDDEEEEA